MCTPSTDYTTFKVNDKSFQYKGVVGKRDCRILRQVGL